jgi:PLP dependent protein
MSTSDEMRIAERLALVRDRVERAAHGASRDPNTVRLIAVSKTKPAEAIRAAYDAGQRDFGENYAQELVQKAEALQDLAGIRWHFIGHLQTNKAKYIARHAHVVHTIDTPSLARELGKRVLQTDRGRLQVLVEVNVGAEPAKHGTTATALPDVLQVIEDHESLVLCGLMTMPPHDLEGARRAFEALASLRKIHGGEKRLPELSMGMSDDLEVAVACGATMVRVGTAIFGAR